MHLVNGNRRVEGIIFCPVRHPRIVMPGIILQVPHARRGTRPNFGGETIRVSLVDCIASSRDIR